MKDIKDYLHLYMGCEVWKQWTYKTSIITHQNIEVLLGSRIGIIKPYLRPLSDMTEDEADMIISIRELDGVYREDSKVSAAIDCVTGYTWPNTFQAAAEATRYLLSKHFDLFGLIQSGLAMDKSNKTIKT